MRQLPKELAKLDCSQLQKAIVQASFLSAIAWNVDLEDATEEVVSRLNYNRVSRSSLTSALRYLREIPEQDAGEI